MDLENKITSLQGIFSLFDRDTIIQVLKRNNENFENSAAELSDMEAPAPKPQPVNTTTTLPRPSIPPFVQPQPVNTTTTPSRPSTNNNQVVQEVATLLGGGFDIHQSTILDVYQATGGKIHDTVSALKNLHAPDPALEEQKRRLLELEQERKRKHEEMLARVQRENMAKERDLQVLIEREAKLKEEQDRKNKQEEVIKKLYIERQLAEEMRLKKEVEQRTQRESLERARLQAEREAFERAKLQAEREVIERKQQAEREALEVAREQRLKDERVRLLEEKKRLEEEKMAKQMAEIEYQERLKRDLERKKQDEIDRELSRIREEYQRVQKESDSLAKELSQKLVMEQKARQQLEEELACNREAEERMHREAQDREVTLKKRLQEIEQKRVEEEMKLTELSVQREQEILRIHQLEEELKSRELMTLQQQSMIFVDPVLNKPATLTVHHEQASDIVVNYNLGNQIYASCWIGIYPTHQPKHDRYLSYQAIPHNTNEGVLVFNNIIPGNYEARLFANKYDLVLVSSTILIGPSVKISAHVLGDEIHVSYSTEPTSLNPTRDWIGLYSKGLRNKKYIDSTYANGFGNAIFKSPRTPGEYSVRYFVYPTKFNEQAVSNFEIIDMDKIEILNPIVAKGEEIRIEYSINTVVPSTSDWVGLYPVGEVNNKNYIASKYTTGSGGGLLSFASPDQPGEYEVRFFSSSKGKYNVFKVSNKLVIPA